MTKRIIILAVLLTTAVLLAACSGASDTGGADQPVGQQPLASSTTIPPVDPAEGQVPSASPSAASKTAQMLVTRDDIRQEADGKYFVPDRGDGCYYVEVWRTELKGEERVGLQAPDCSEEGDLVWEFSPDSGDLRPVLARYGPSERWHSGLTAVSSLFQQRANGTCFLPDTGNGFAYEEVATYPRGEQVRVLLRASACQPNVPLTVETSNVETVPVYMPLNLPTLRDPTPFPTQQEIQVGPDGKYVIRGRADGCDYDEQERNTTTDGTLSVLLVSSGCSPVRLIRHRDLGDPDILPVPRGLRPPVPGEVIKDSPDPQKIYQGADGKYFIPDRGDGCVWTEQQRLALVPLAGEEHVVVYLHSEECHPAFYFRYDVTGQTVAYTERLGPEGAPLPEILWPLPVTLEDIQQDEAGTYAVPARADGCAYSEYGRPVIDGQAWVVLAAPLCYLLWRYAPATGELIAMQNDWWPIHEAPDVSDIQQQPDGKYFVIDRGDGCPWRESFRALLGEGTRQHLMVYFTSDCSTADWEVPAYHRVAYDATTGELVALPPT